MSELRKVEVNYMTAYVFPGQGAQVKGMGEKLFDEFAEFTEKADKILGYSLKELCLKDPEQKLNFTQYTQPALYVVNALTYYKKRQEINKKPDFLAGHSLGEYNALLAANIFDFETGLRLVKKRGEIMGRTDGGAMAAVVGLPKESIEEIFVKYNLTGIDISNLNTRTQIVISGYKEDIEKAKSIFENEGGRYIILKVSAAFHSRYMQGAKEEFEQYLKKFDFSDFSIPVISNLTAQPYDSNCIIHNLSNHLRFPVNWADSIRYIMNQGEVKFEEVGPGHILTNMIEKIKSETNSGEKEILRIDANIPKTKVEDPMQKVADWNRIYPIGTKVMCQGYSNELVTRTDAFVLFGHRAAIYVEGYNGYFDLDEISVVSD